ncbi:MAG TPA: ACT domain-containing protein [Kofleriaceae bacterium]|nr:ACT domain-containing protein [Kofleriaceae bacterium]
MKPATLALTIIGKDRPGIVGTVSDTVLAGGGNWEDSRMARLGGWFAGILLVTVEADRADALAASLAALESQGLRIVVERAEPRGPAAELRHVRLELVGQDHAGIVRDISRALAERGINVEELETEREAAPMGGGDLFRALLEISAPPEVPLAELRSALEALANDLMVDLSVVAQGD